MNTNNQRTVKFRVWDLDSKCFWLDNDYFWIQNGRVYRDGGGEYEFFLTEIDNCIIQQFTGLFDKSGKEIYEGDIIKMPEDDRIQQIKFLKGGFWILPVKKKDLDYKYNIGAWHEYIEIIGNIFENPELIKE